MTAPATITSTWAAAPPQASTTAAAATAMARRITPRASVRPICQTAVATTATAASSRPCTQPSPATSPPPTPDANATSSTADGRVKPSHAARPPSGPARSIPIEKPSWLDAGPGRNWTSATRSAKSASSSHRRRATYASRK